ncbi:hypothetical protein ACKI1I_44530 [Streptomyces turgidiscabies]|uniref:hypothetical protein n=1 Tax=Streptomyces turgidiscabies TaxID=85558 RepID=UPI00131A385E|nr:hypothetical protein [Streptomyces turgidiscabies]MDX3500091.1 hypothetical protein [Streptomyces turgidiscabies]
MADVWAEPVETLLQREGSSLAWSFDCKGVKALWEGWADEIGRVATSAAGDSVWLVMVLVASLTVVGGALAEWQRRTTLLALVQKAPPGTVVIQEGGRGGPGMRVQVGAPGMAGEGEGAMREATADSEGNSRPDSGTLRP